MKGHSFSCADEVLMSLSSRGGLQSDEGSAFRLFGTLFSRRQAVIVFEDLYDAISLLWSSQWPSVEGEVTSVDVERLERRRGESLRLAVAYKFSIGDDGPYTGESFWEPSYRLERVAAARDKFHEGQTVLIRYRRDDPSVNTLDRSVWADL